VLSQRHSITTERIALNLYIWLWKVAFGVHLLLQVFIR